LVQGDTFLSLSGAQARTILACYPELIAPKVLHPDSAYLQNVPTSRPEGREPICKGFVSEVGQDAYFVLYAHYLKQHHTKHPSLEGYRQKVDSIYNHLNQYFGILAEGGTFYGHQARRILGYTEYAVYCLEHHRLKDWRDPPFAEKRQSYLDTLTQRMERQMESEPWRVEAHQKLRRLIADLKKVLTDAVYLKLAIEFQEAHYTL
jgi:hypothetical protein